MNKQRSAASSLKILMGQHFDNAISLKRRVGIMLARWSQIGSTYGDPQIVDGTIGRLTSAFLMQLVGSPSTRPAYGHLWGIGGVPAIHNGDGTATPIKDLWANKDTDVAALTVDVGTQSVSAGDFGVIMRGTFDDAQDLVFLKGGSGGSGGGGGGWYGDGFHGALTAPMDTTSWAGIAVSHLVAGGEGATYGLADGTYVHALDAGASFDLHCTDLTIPAGVVVMQRNSSVIRCTGTCTIDGILSASGDHALFASLKMGGESSFGNIGPVGFVGDGNGAQGIAGGNLPVDEGAGVTPNAALNSGAGGGAGARTGGGGRGNNRVPAAPSDGGRGLTRGTGDWLRTLPGAATGYDYQGVHAAGNASTGGSGAASTGTGGQGGAGAGAVVLCAKTIRGSGQIDVSGGQGQPGKAGNGGGGGGGNPGGASVVSDDFSGPTFLLTAGAGGAGIGTGSAGASGGATGWSQVMKPVS